MVVQKLYASWVSLRYSTMHEIDVCAVESHGREGMSNAALLHVVTLTAFENST